MDDFPDPVGPVFEHDAVAQLHDLLQRIRQVQLGESGNIVGDDAHNDGAGTALLENVDAESGDAGDSIREVCRTVGFQFASGRFIFAHDVVGQERSVLRSEALQSLKFEFDELAADFHLRRAARGKDQVTDVGVTLQHRRHQLRGMNFARGERSLRR